MTTKYVKIYQLSSSDDIYNYDALRRACGSDSHTNKLFEKNGTFYYSDGGGAVADLYGAQLETAANAGNNSGISEQLLCAAIAAVSGKILK
jgi:hypothetical protein